MRIFSSGTGTWTDDSRRAPSTSHPKRGAWVWRLLPAASPSWASMTSATVWRSRLTVARWPSPVSSGPIHLWDTITGREKGRRRGHAAGAAPRLAFTANGRHLVSVGEFDREVRVWDLSTGRG